MATVVLEKVKTDGIFNGVRFCVWELLRIIELSCNKGSKHSYIIEKCWGEFCRHMVDIKNHYFWQGQTRRYGR